MLFECDFTGAELPAEMTDEDGGFLLVSRLDVQPELFLLVELSRALLLLAPKYFLPVAATEYSVDVSLVPGHTVLALQLLSTNLAGKQRARVDPEVLIVADLRLEFFPAVLALLLALQVDLGVLHQVAGGFELLLTSRTHEVPPLRVLVDGDLVLPHVGPGDGGVTAVGAEVGLRAVAVRVEMVTEMTPGFEGLGTTLTVANKQTGAVLVRVDVILVVRVGLGLEAQ